MLEKMINYIEKNLIVKTMYVILDNIFFQRLTQYKFELKEEKNKFIIKVEAIEELSNKKIITNTTLEVKSFVNLILGKEGIENKLRKELLGEDKNVY